MTVRWEQASTIQQLDSHTYNASIPQEWAVGTVPNGGFITSCFLRVARLHFSTTLAKQNQPDTITLHLEFLRRTQIGHATLKVKEMKLGRQASILSITLYQDDREEVTGYLSNTNFKTEQGLTLPTHWKMDPPPPPVDLRKLATDSDENWALQKVLPFEKFRNSSSRVKWHFPREGQQYKSIANLWLSFSTGDKITQDALGFIADTFPLVIEGYLDGDVYKTDAKDADGQAIKAKHRPGRFWYPTLLLNIDFVRALPAEGVDFVFVRSETKRIINGRYDIEVAILDESGKLIALSHHVALAVDASRNLADRSGKNGKL